MLREVVRGSPASARGVYFLHDIIAFTGPFAVRPQDIGPVRRHLRVATYFFTMVFISDHKKYRESSLEPGKHEKQLFISVWNREVRKLRGFCSTSAPKNNSIPLNFTHHAT